MKNDIGDDGMKVFASVAFELPFLEILDLDRNHIGDEGMKAFADAIGSGALPMLQKLDLNVNDISDGGFVAFSYAIRNLQKMRFIWLWDNCIGNEGMKAFAEAIRNGALPQLERLYIQCNQIGIDGMIAFSTAIINGALASLSFVSLDYISFHSHAETVAACTRRNIRCQF